jgi:hypothetical protein
MRLRLFLPTVLLAVVAAPLSVFAQALADRIPDDAIAYIGWRGTEAMPEYGTSRLKGIIDAADLPKQMAAAVNAGLARQTDAKRAAAGKAFVSLFESVIKHPGSLYFGGMDFTVPEKPVPSMAILIEAGPDAAAMLDQANQWIDAAKQQNADAPLKAEAVDKYLVISIGQPPSLAARLGTGDTQASTALANKKEFQAALSHVRKDALLTVYVSIPGLIKLMDEGVAARPDPQGGDRWNKLKDLLNTAAIHELIYTGTFQKDSWSTEGFMALSGQRTGFPALLDSKPMDADVLKLVPKSAIWAGLIRFDFTRLLDEIRAAAVRSDENGKNQFDFVLQSANSFLGLDLEKDLFATLSDQWLYYGTPSTDKGSGDLTIINPLRDAAKAEKTIATLEDFINQRLSDTLTEKAPYFAADKVDGIDVHSMALPNGNIAPSWAMGDGNLYISLSAQAVIAAVKQGAGKENSILDNEDFAALRKQLVVAAPAGFFYNDISKTGPTLYARMVEGAAKAAAEHPENPHMTLPPFEKIVPYLSPALTFYYADSDGWHAEGIEPFPGSGMLGGGTNLMQKIAAQREKAQADNPTAPKTDRLP